MIVPQTWSAPSTRSVFTLPLVGRVARRNAAEAGGVGVSVRHAPRATTTTPTPNPSPQGGGEQSESAATVVHYNHGVIACGY